MPPRTGWLRWAGGVTLGALASGALWTPCSGAQVQSERAVASVNGVDLHYQVLGAGPPVVVLHGLAANGDFMLPVVQGLASDHTLVIPDLPGHGKSGSHPGPFSYRQVAADVFRLMDTLGHDRFQAIGWSAGGSTLWHMATMDPDRIEAMVVIAGPSRFPPLVRQNLRSYPQFAELSEPMRQYLTAAHPGGAVQLDRILAAFRDIGSNEAEVSFGPAELSCIRARTLIVWGDRDDVPPEVALEIYRAIPGASLWIIPDQQHFPLWPAWGGSVEAAIAFPTTVRSFFGLTPG